MLSGSSVTPPLPELDHCSLLINLKKSIELLFLARRDATHEVACNVESFNYVGSSLESILLDGLKTLTGDKFIKFVNDLNWLHKAFMLRNDKNNLEKIEYNSKEFNPKIRHEFLSSWIQLSLINNCLCASLQLLVSDKELLQSYYNKHSFLQNDNYSTALFICLSAIELNHSSLLSQIDASLYQQSGPAVSLLNHKRSSSHPNFSISPNKNDEAIIASNVKSKFPILPREIKLLTFRKWKSLPNLKPSATKNRPRCKTFSQTSSLRKHIEMALPNKIVNNNHQLIAKEITHNQYNESLPSTSANAIRQDNQKNLKIELLKCDDIKIWYDESSTQQFNNGNEKIETAAETLSASPINTTSIDYCIPTQPKTISPINSFFSNIFNYSPNKQTAQNWSCNNNLSGTSTNLSSSSQTDSVFNSFILQNGTKLLNQNANSIFDDNSMLNNEFFLLNASQFGLNKKQTLASFLESFGLTRNNTDLEKENAHFKVSEAIISAIEHIKCTKNEQKTEEKYEVQSSSHGSSGSSTDLLERTHVHRSEIININSNKSSLPESDNSVDENGQVKSASEVERETDLEKPAEISNSQISYAELAEKAVDTLSAERVGLSLIAKFNDKQLPKVSDLKWLVSDEDTPQELLPMPGSSPSANPEDHIIHSLTRGTRYWAPPRPQIIFTDHLFTTRKELILKQNNRCAGCGMRVASVYINRFRYCTYLGKYHCTGCHRNQISAIPAKILGNWDFKCYPVSVFAYRLLDQISSYPLFNVYYLNPSLFLRIKNLEKARLKRVQIKFVKDFIKTCRFAEELQLIFTEIPEYITSDPGQWSMNDFYNARDKSLKRQLETIIAKCEEHILNCVLCSARGFICELCSKETVIFPWQTNVVRCESCGTCFHKSCFKKLLDCVKCQRIQSRQQNQQ